jgi:uncharacterized protein involved in copper resistance
VPANSIGSGLYDAELGFRLRYEFKREFAPNIGISWESEVSGNGWFAHAAGDDVQSTDCAAVELVALLELLLNYTDVDPASKSGP